jgi:hypothetical protein
MRFHTPFRTALRAAVVTFAATVSLASSPAAHAYAYAYQPSTVAPDESDLDNHRAYTNRDGQSVHSPAHSRSGRVPEGASAPAAMAPTASAATAAARARGTAAWPNGYKPRRGDPHRAGHPQAPVQ